MPLYSRQRIFLVQMFPIGHEYYCKANFAISNLKFQQLNNSKNVCQKKWYQNDNNWKQNIPTIKIDCHEYGDIGLLRVKYLWK